MKPRTPLGDFLVAYQRKIVAARCDAFVIIEVMVSPDDLSPVTRTYITGAARASRAQGARA
jgi:hypothetical protein